ncbi:hypothetical protein GGI42DRAFT_271930 [Trichoderma sp. SZMC 28013]
MAPAAYIDRDGHLEAGLLKSTQGEKQTGYQHLTQQTPRNKKMVYFRRALFIIAVGFVLGLGVATARPSVVNCHNSKVAVAKTHASNGELAEALQKASPDLLHRLLHAYLPERYQHGVFPSDRDAIDAIHGDDPSVASAIVQIAKRQEDTPNNNSTIPNGSSTTSSSSSSTSIQESSTTSPEQSTTDSSSSSTTTPEQSSTESTTSQPASNTAGSTTTDSSSSTTAPPSTTAGRTTTDEQTTTNTGSATSTEPPSSTTSPSESSTTTDNSITSSTTQTSEGPATTITSGTKTTSAPVLHTYTRTLPNGGTTTLTSTSWVAVVPTDQAEGSKSPDLQNAASLPRGEMVLPAVVGLLVGAVLMV